MSENTNNHLLVPKHSKLSDSDKDKLFEKYTISFRELPKILKGDSAIAKLDASVGDIIKITRKSKTAGVAYYYRVVIDG